MAIFTASHHSQVLNAKALTTFPESTPFAFTPSFYTDPQKSVQWTAFVKKSKPDIPVGDLSAVIADIAVFLVPVLESLQSKTSFDNEWVPGQGWNIRP
jgi:hypothetical protein